METCSQVRASMPAVHEYSKVARCAEACTTQCTSSMSLGTLNALIEQCLYISDFPELLISNISEISMSLYIEGSKINGSLPQGWGFPDFWIFGQGGPECLLPRGLGLVEVFGVHLINLVDYVEAH